MPTGSAPDVSTMPTSAASGPKGSPPGGFAVVLEVWTRLDRSDPPDRPVGQGGCTYLLRDFLVQRDVPGLVGRSEGAFRIQHQEGRIRGGRRTAGVGRARAEQVVVHHELHHLAGGAGVGRIEVDAGNAAAEGFV